MLGENIHITTLDEDISGEGLVDLWEKETEYYDFDNPRWQKGISLLHAQLLRKSDMVLYTGIITFYQLSFPGKMVFLCRGARYRWYSMNNECKVYCVARDYCHNFLFKQPSEATDKAL